MKTLLVDLDGVLANLGPTWYARYNQLHPDNVLTQDTVDAWDIPQAKHTKDLFKILSEPGLFRGLPVIAGAQEGLKTLYDYRVNKKRVYDIYIVTAATATTYTIREKLEWLDEHFPWMDRRHFIAAFNKKMVRGDFLIDDGPHNIEQWVIANQGAGAGIVIDYPYNRDLHMGGYESNVFRAHSYLDTVNAWEEIVERVVVATQLSDVFVSATAI